MELDIRQHRQEEAAAREHDLARLRRGELDPDSLSVAAQLSALVQAPIRFDQVQPQPLANHWDDDADDQ